MAPLSTPVSSFASTSSKRQEACALTCLSSTDPGSCSDAACLCASASWGPLVLACIQSTCESESSLDSAYSQLLQYCEAVDTPFTLPEPAYTQTTASSPTSATASATGQTSSTAAAVPSASSSASVATISSTPLNISKIMAAVCSFLFAIALVVGYLGIRDKLRKARHQSTAKPSRWSGAQAVASTRTADLKSNTERQTGPDVGAHSSIYGANTSHFDTAGYADLELEDRRQQARREREKAADLIRQENLHGLFAAPVTSSGTVISPTASTSSPSLPDLSRASSFSSKAAHDHKGYGTSDEENDDDEGQYVTLPRLGMGLGRGEHALGTASTFGAPLDTGSSNEGAWARTPPGDSTTALQGQSTPNRGGE